MNIPEQCNAEIDARNGCPPMVCDRERGHAGPHRGYNWQIDEPMFWNKHPGVSGLSRSSRAAPAKTPRR